MSDNPMCSGCPLEKDAKACLIVDCGAYSTIEYCGIPAICLDLICWEVKKCDFRGNIQECPELPEWRKENPGRCEICGAICGHHWDKCPK